MISDSELFDINLDLPPETIPSPVKVANPVFDLSNITFKPIEQVVNITSAPKAKTTKQKATKSSNATKLTANPEGQLVASNIYSPPEELVTPDPSEGVYVIHDFEIKESLFTQEELALKPLEDVFTKNSKIKNDELVKFFIIKYKIMEYKCSGRNCPMKGAIWRRRPAYLILNRKNNRQNDLTTNNLSLICPNCYVQDKGAELFNNFKSRSESKCIGCGYPVKKGFELCYVCSEKMRKVSAVSTVDDYAELAIRTEQSGPHINESKPAPTPSTDAITFSIQDFDKEIAALGIGLGSKTVTPAIPSIDLDAELAKYKAAIATDLDNVGNGILPANIKKSKSVPSGVIHYTKHRATGLPASNGTQSKLNLAVTQELLDALADI